MMFVRWVEGNLCVSICGLPQRHTGHTPVHRMQMLGISSSSRVNPSFSSIRDEQMDGLTYNSLSTLCLSRHRKKTGIRAAFCFNIVKWFETCCVSECGHKNTYISIYTQVIFLCICIFTCMPTIPQDIGFTLSHLSLFHGLQAIQYWECVHGTGSPGLVIKIPLPISFLKWGSLGFQERPNFFRYIELKRGRKIKIPFVDEGMIDDWLNCVDDCWYGCFQK